MSKDSTEDLHARHSPLSAEFSTPKSSLVDLTMSRVDLDPSVGGERDTPVAMDLETPSMIGEGLLGAVEPGDFGMNSGSATSSPGEESSRKEERHSMMAERMGQAKVLEQKIPGPLGKYRLQWGGSLGTGLSEEPWRPLPGRRHLDVDQEVSWHPLPGQTSTIGPSRNVVNPGHSLARDEYTGGMPPVVDPLPRWDYQGGRASVADPLPRHDYLTEMAPRADVSHRGGYQGVATPAVAPVTDRGRSSKDELGMRSLNSRQCGYEVAPRRLADQRREEYGSTAQPGLVEGNNMVAEGAVGVTPSVSALQATLNQFTGLLHQLKDLDLRVPGQQADLDQGRQRQMNSGSQEDYSTHGAVRDSVYSRAHSGGRDSLLVTAGSPVMAGTSLPLQDGVQGSTGVSGYQEVFNPTRPSRRDSDSGYRGRSNRKTLHPKSFKGDFGTWEEYQIYWERLVKWNDWVEEEATDALMLALDGDAAIHVHSLPHFRSLTQSGILDALADRFGAARTLTEDKRVLRTRVKLQGETYEHLAQDLMRLSHRVFRGAPHLAEQEARDAFIKALPPGLRCPIAAANPHTLNECVDNMTQMRAVLGDADVDQYGQVNVQTVQVNAIDTVCYGCHKKGHYRRDCPEGSGNGRDSAVNGRDNTRRNGQDGTRRPVVCYNCDEPGHVVRNCQYENRATNIQGNRVGPLILKAATSDSAVTHSGNENRSSK